jgi:hypothetical protein
MHVSAAFGLRRKNPARKISFEMLKSAAWL